MTIMELRFNAMLYSSLRKDNSDLGHISCSRGPHVPHPCSKRNWHTVEPVSLRFEHDTDIRLTIKVAQLPTSWNVSLQEEDWLR